MKSLSMKTPELLPRTQAEKSWERVFEAHQALWGKWGRGRAYSFLAWSFPLPLALTFPCCMRCLGASQRVSQNRLASNRCSSRHELLPLWIRNKFNLKSVDMRWSANGLFETYHLSRSSVFFILCDSHISEVETVHYKVSFTSLLRRS